MNTRAWHRFERLSRHKASPGFREDVVAQRPNACWLAVMVRTLLTYDNGQHLWSWR